MSHYRGYFMQGERIAAPAIIEATDDAQAMLEAGDINESIPSHRSAQETRVVGALSTPAPSHEHVAKDDRDASEDGVSNFAE